MPPGRLGKGPFGDLHRHVLNVLRDLALAIVFSQSARRSHDKKKRFKALSGDGARPGSIENISKR